MISTLDNSVRLTLDGLEYRLVLSDAREVIAVYRLDHRPTGTSQRPLKLGRPRAREVIAYHREFSSPSMEKLLSRLSSS